MRKFRLPSLIADISRPVLFAIVMMAIVVGLFTYRLGKLTPAASADEVSFVSSSKSVSQVIDNPLYVYQKVGNVAFKKINKQSILTARALNSAIGIAAVVAMYAVLKRWYTTRVSILATALFASSSWLLYTARFASPDMSYVLPLGLVLGGMWMHDGRYLRTAAVIAATTTVLLLYVPAMIWLLLPAIIWQRKFIRSTLSNLSVVWQALVVVAFLVGITPLIWSFTNNPELIKTWLGIPAVLPSPVDFIKNVARVPLNLFVRSTGNPATGIGRLPILDIFTGVMVVLGVYVNAYKLRLDRTKLMLGAAVIGSLFVALDGPVSISFLLPFVYLAAAGGVALLLQQWFTVFPRNPLARAIGVVIVTSAVGMACFYHLNKYFIAWPNVPATKSSFQQQLN